MQMKFSQMSLEFEENFEDGTSTADVKATSVRVESSQRRRVDQ
jgi:hypothetical protein